MIITVINEKTRELIVDFDSESGSCICMNGYSVNVSGKEDRWISVKDRLPEPWTTILFCVPSRRRSTVVSGHMEEKRNEFIPSCSMYSYEEDKVTHWMPLPEPPEVEE